MTDSLTDEQLGLLNRHRVHFSGPVFGLVADHLPRQQVLILQKLGFLKLTIVGNKTISHLTDAGFIAIGKEPNDYTKSIDLS